LSFRINQKKPPLLIKVKEISFGQVQNLLRINMRTQKMAEKYPINIWINDERYEKLQEAGLANMTEDVLAGMRVLKLQCTEEQKDEILRLYPMAK